MANRSSTPNGAAYTYTDETVESGNQHRYVLMALGLNGSESDIELGSVLVGGSEIFLPLIVR